MTQTPNPSHGPFQYPQFMPMGYMPPPVTDDTINLLDIWRILVQAKWLIFSVTLLCTVAAITLALTMTPIYKTEILLEPVTEDGKKGGGALSQFGGLAAMAGINIGGGGGSKESALAKLQSRVFLDAFIRDENLLPILYEKEWDNTIKNWKNPAKIPKPYKYVKDFKELLKIQDDKKTGLITMTIEWHDAKQATLWANLLVKRINRFLRDIAIEEAQKSMEYLNLELAKTQMVEIRQVIASLLENQIKKIMLANVNDEFAFKIIDPAIVPEQRIKPKRTLMTILGFVAGGFLGIMIALVRNALRNQKPAAKATG